VEGVQPGVLLVTQQRQAVERSLQGFQGLGAEEVGEGVQGSRLQDETAVGWGDGQDPEGPYKGAWQVRRLQKGDALCLVLRKNASLCRQGRSFF